MEWPELLERIQNIKTTFEKAYKCLTQNRQTHIDTVNRHSITLIDSFNEARLLIYQHKDVLTNEHWSETSRLLIRLRNNIQTVKDKHNLNLILPSILNTPAKLELGENLEVRTEDIQLEEEDLTNLTIPAVITLDSKDILSESEESDDNSRIMVDTAAAQRAYIREIAQAVPEFDGKKTRLEKFLTALRLVNLTKGTYEEIAIELIKSKITGTTLNKIKNETTIDGIIARLKAVVVGETPANIKAKMDTLTQKGKTATQFTTELENLRQLLEAAYIDQGIPSENADTLSTTEAINTMISKTSHESVKTVMESGIFTTMDAAVSAYIRTSTRLTGSVNTVMYSKRGNNNYRGSNNRGNYRGRGNGNYQNRGNNNYGNQNNNYHRGRGNGNNNSNRGRNNQNNNNTNNVRVTQNNQGNSQQPSDIQQ